MNITGATITRTEELSSQNLFDELSDSYSGAFGVEANGWIECGEFIKANSWAYGDGEQVTVAFGQAPEGWGNVDTCACDSCTQLRKDREYASAA